MRMTKVLRDWLDYLEEEAAVYSCLSEELNRLLKPYAVKNTQSDESETHGGEVPAHLPDPAPRAEDGILTDVRRGLERANRARQRAVKNLLPEVALSQSDAVREGEVHPNGDGFSVVAESVLRDLIAKHSITERSTDEAKQGTKPGCGRESGVQIQEPQTSGGKPGASRPDTGGKKASIKPRTTGTGRPVTATRRHPNSKKTNMYRTSSSVIGEGLKKAQRGKNVRTVGERVPGSVSTSDRVGQKNARGKAAINGPGSLGKACKEVKIGETGKNDERIKLRGHTALPEVIPGDPASVGKNDRHISSREVSLPRGTTEMSGACEDRRVERDHCGQNGRSNDSLSQTPSSGSPNRREQMFDLVRDGKDIEIPETLKKLISTNRKWKSKIIKKSTSSHSSAFLERMTAPLTMNMTAKEVDRLYGYYSAEIAELKQRIASLEKNGSLSTDQLAMLDSRISEIRAGVASLDQLRKTTLSMSEEVPQPILTTGPMSPPSLEYTTLKQLETYTDLQLRARILEYTQKLEQELADYLLSLISGHTEELSSGTYRRIEGLLSHGAALFPSMVRCGDDHSSSEELSA